MGDLPLNQPKTFTQKEPETTTVSTPTDTNPGHALIPTGYTPPHTHNHSSRTLYSLPTEEQARALQAAILGTPSKQSSMSPSKKVTGPITDVDLKIPGVITWHEHLARAVRRSHEQEENS